MGLFTRKKAPTTVDSLDMLEVYIADEAAVVVDFYADWCAPCRQMKGLIKELAGDLDGRAEVLKVDVDASPEIASRFGVKSIPTLLVFRDGKPRQRFAGLVDRNRILQAVGARDLMR